MSERDPNETGDRREGEHWNAESQELTVPATAKGKRLDAWLASDADGLDEKLSRSRVQRLIEQGHVALNGRAVDSARTKLAGGEIVTVRVPPPLPASPRPEAITLDILHEDDDLIIIVKPVGMVVHPGAGVSDGTLVNALLHHCGSSLSGIGGVARPGIVHRLDRDTSGVMVVAKNDAAHASLSAQFADHGRTGALERSYQAIVWGVPVPPAGRIDAPLRRDPRDRTRRAVGEGADARHAVTHFRTLEAHSETSLVECRLETGRTHQIRVHMAHRGHPLLGDATYGTAFRSKSARLGEEAQRALAGLEGQALHAASLAFEHPRSRQVLRFEAPLPERMEALLEALRSGS